MRLLNRKKEKRKEKKAVKGCKLILCEDPITGNMKFFPVKCPKGYMDKAKSECGKQELHFPKNRFQRMLFWIFQKSDRVGSAYYVRADEVVCWFSLLLVRGSRLGGRLS